MIKRCSSATSCCHITLSHGICSQVFRAKHTAKAWTRSSKKPTVDKAQILADVYALGVDPENAGQSVQAALRLVRGQIEGQADARTVCLCKEINRILEGRNVGADSVSALTMCCFFE